MREITKEIVLMVSEELSEAIDDYELFTKKLFIILIEAVVLLLRPLPYEEQAMMIDLLSNTIKEKLEGIYHD